MTLGVTMCGITVLGDGVTTAFVYPFNMEDAADAVITYTDPTGVQTTLSPTQYTITGIGQPTGGTVTYPLSGAPMPAGSLLTIQRIVPLVQTTSVVSQGPTFGAIEGELDYEVMIDQQQQYTLDRTLQLNIADRFPMPQLPPAAVRAGQFLFFDSQGNPTVGASIGVVPVSAAMQPVIAANTVTLALALMGGILSFASIAALRAYNSVAPAVVYVEGWYAADDGGEGFFVLGATAGDNGGTIIVDAAAHCWHRAMQRSTSYSVLWFGAKGDGIADDTAEITTALTVGAGSAVYFPAGRYLVSGQINIPPSTMLYGAGQGGTVFVVGSATADILVASPGVAANDITIRGVSFVPKGGITRSAGAYVRNDTTYNFLLEDFSMEGAFIGVHLSNTYAVIRHASIRDMVPATGTGIVIDGGNDHYISHILMDNPSGQPAAGIALYATGGDWICDCDLIRCGTGMFISPGNGQEVAWVDFSQVSCDTCSNSGWVIQTTGTGDVRGLVLQNCWGGSCQETGMIINGLGGFVDGVYLTNFRAVNNLKYGILVEGHAKNFHSIGGLITGNSIGSPLIYDGINIQADVVGVHIEGMKIGQTAGWGDTQAAGIKVMAGIGDSITLVNNDVFTANTPISYAASGPSRYIANNPGFRTSNAGQASIANGGSSVVVNHGLEVQPQPWEILVTPVNSPLFAQINSYWIDTVTSSSFTFHVAAPVNSGVGTAFFFNWQARTLGA